MFLAVGSNTGQVGRRSDYFYNGIIFLTHYILSLHAPFIKIISSQLLSIYLLLLIITLSMINSLESNLTPDFFRRNAPSLGTVGLL